MAAKVKKPEIISLSYTPDFPGVGQVGLVFDVETTGLDSLCDRIWEITLILVKKTGIGRYQVLDEKDIYINPEVPMNAEASRVTGVTDEDLQKYPLECEVFRQIYDMVSKAEFICGHNIDSFDLKFLDQMYARNGKFLEVSKIAEHSIDTLKLSRELVVKGVDKNADGTAVSSHKLGSMVEYFDLSGKVDGAFHCSLTDTRYNLLVLEKLEPLYNDKYEIMLEQKAEQERKSHQVTVKSCNVWIGSFKAAYCKANFLFVNTADGSRYMFNRYTYQWSEKEVTRSVDIEDVKKAVYAFTGTSDDAELARWDNRKIKTA